MLHMLCVTHSGSGHQSHTSSSAAEVVYETVAEYEYPKPAEYEHPISPAAAAVAEYEHPISTAEVVYDTVDDVVGANTDPHTSHNVAYAVHKTVPTKINPAYGQITLRK